MKIGSIVEAVKETVKDGWYSSPEIKKNTPYDVIDMSIERGEFVICIAQFPNFWYLAEDFREIEFPPSMEADIQEALVKETPKELIQTQ